MVTLNDQTFVEYFSQHMKPDSVKSIYLDYLRRIRETLTPAQLKAGSRLLESQSVSPRRLLTTNWVPASTPFIGDVTVVPPVPASIDSSYTAFLGAIGSGGNEGSRPVPHLPINMTMHFP
jgi:hypothetical protein